MKLKTPVTGSIIEVKDDEAQLYISQGFAIVKEPVKKAARKRTAKPKEQ